jgi:DNA-binding response OmpR family regulator/anti-sigma regulatory factor (Ser/Thr protein kinase)
LRNQVNSFEYLAKEKEIKLKFNAVNDTVITFFDSDKLEKIINNLLSNAFKFTEKNGAVIINVSIVIDDSNEKPVSNEQNERYIEIAIKDTGIGIAQEHLEKIFIRFFQTNEAKEHSGTGIGLALTRELVKLLKGQIYVESKKGKGSKFTIRLPYIPDLISDEEIKSTIPSHDEESGSSSSEKTANKDLLSEKIMLIVEDNTDVRKFIRTNFEGDFHIEEANDGKEGLALAQKIIPDIILTDVMMPVMDGNELCKKLKKDERTSHIPILMLTALTSKENTIEGLSSGADDYITKPFDTSILKTKIDNLLSIRQLLRDKFSAELVLAPTNISVTSPDEKFLRKAIEVIEKNMDDPEFDTEKFSAIIGVSRMQLYRKLSALTNMTVKEFIRDIRLKRAGQLLLQKKLTISEIAYATGFKDMSHFRKCFRDKFGMNATDYIEKGDKIQ